MFWALLAHNVQDVNHFDRRLMVFLYGRKDEKIRWRERKSYIMRNFGRMRGMRNANKIYVAGQY
jgi:hypothetical protein